MDIKATYMVSFNCADVGKCKNFLAIVLMQALKISNLRLSTWENIPDISIYLVKMF